MSQEQSDRPRDKVAREPVKYGDVFDVGGDLATKPITPQDAATMQTAETTAFGAPPTGGPADVMLSAATLNAQAGLVGGDDVTDAARAQGVTITGTNVPGGRIITESFGGQVVGHYVQVAAPATGGGEGKDDEGGQERVNSTEAAPQAKVTIGQAVEATIRTVGDKPVDFSDAAAIAEAEVRATGSTVLSQVGCAAKAQSAAAYNTGISSDEDKLKIKDVVGVKFLYINNII